jgi:hypothetical protein
MVEGAAGFHEPVRRREQGAMPWMTKWRHTWARRKILFAWAWDGDTSTAHVKKVFFASFCSPKEAPSFAGSEICP